MTEQEYINTTNLAKLRMAVAILRDVQDDGKAMRDVLDEVYRLIEKYDSRTKIK